VESRSNGHGPGSGGGDVGPLPLARRRLPGPSTKPALVVLGLAVALFGLGVGLELASGTQSRPTASPSSIATARGAVLHAVPSRPLLKTIVVAGQPPDDLLDALAVPQGSAPVPSSAIDQGVEAYDRSLRFEVPSTQQNVITFFRAQLPSQHWKLLNQGPASGGYRLLEQHPASDGLEWELGVTVEPTVFGSAAGVGSPTSGTTAFTFRLFAQSDQN